MVSSLYATEGLVVSPPPTDPFEADENTDPNLEELPDSLALFANNGQLAPLSTPELEVEEVAPSNEASGELGIWMARGILLLVAAIWGTNFAVRDCPRLRAGQSTFLTLFAFTECKISRNSLFSSSLQPSSVGSQLCALWGGGSGEPPATVEAKQGRDFGGTRVRNIYYPWIHLSSHGTHHDQRWENGLYL
jgi:hypothetical protein